MNFGGKYMNDELLQVKVAVIDNIAAITSKMIETTSDQELSERMKMLADAILQPAEDNVYEFILADEEKEEFGQFIESLSQYWMEIEAKPEIEEKMFGLMISIIAHTDTKEYHLESKSLAGTNLAGELFNIAQKKMPAKV
jgi:hypothetical protein